VQQTRDQAKARSSAKEQFEIQLLNDATRCQENSIQIHNAYVDLVLKVAPKKHGKTIMPSEILEQANSFLMDKKNECKHIYDERLHEG
jgi:hypothetical protein